MKAVCRQSLMMLRVREVCSRTSHEIIKHALGRAHSHTHAHSVSLLLSLIPSRSAHVRVEQKTWKMVTCPILGVLGGAGESPAEAAAAAASPSLLRVICI